MNRFWFLIFPLLAVQQLSTSRANLLSPWRYECIRGYCQKLPITNATQGTALSLPTCRIFCSDSSAIWPKPTGDVTVGNLLTAININSIDILGGKSETPIFQLVLDAGRVFKDQLKRLIPRRKTTKGGKSLIVQLNIKHHKVNRLTLNLDESYILKISILTDGRVQAVIEAANFFGARHGLETLSQLVFYDDLRGQLQIASDVFISDAPAFPYRGVSLDTSRNYITVDAIKNTLTAMAASKLNTFHWHITDSHSFPWVSKSQPNLSKYGAYSADKIYTPEDVQEIIEFATVRGIRVLPEFDVPAHVGEGWQNTDLVTCLNWQPWQDYCVEPPCGQFDVTKPELYNVLSDIYNDMFEQFQPDIFHIGGDEVNFNCWNSTSSIVEWMSKKGWGRTEADFIKLWNYFQEQALEKVYKAAGKKIPVVIWTSHLTYKEYVLDYLPKDNYIVQIWTKIDDEHVTNLLENGYQVILSNHDALYLDCGFAGWVTDGNNWCSPYIGWQKVYENKPRKFTTKERLKQILGAEATFWTEQADSTSLDSRLWPRASAMAEVLWSDPATSWREAENRFLIHRERLVQLGVQADALEPEWCLQHEENCPLGGKFNVDNRLDE